MDEPLSNLDAKLREEARAWLRELIVRLRLSALVVTHDQTEAMAMSDQILLLNFGGIEQQGTPQEMYNRPQTLFTAEFMGSNNQLPGKVARTCATAARCSAGDGWQLVGRRARQRSRRRRRPPASSGSSACASPTAPGDNRVRLPLVTVDVPRRSLGAPVQARRDCDCAPTAACALAPGEHWLEIPRGDLWIF